MATPLPSGPAGIPGLRRTSVLHPAIGGLGVFLGGSGELRDGLQLQLLLPARVSLPGLGDLRRGSGQQSFLNVITWNVSTGLKSWLRVAGGGREGGMGGGLPLVARVRIILHQRSMTLELGRSNVVSTI